MASSPTTFGRMLPALTLVALVVFGALVLGITLKLREQLRGEVLRREAETIRAVARMQLGAQEEQLAQFSAEFALDDLFTAVLESSRLKGVLAVQLFDAKGALRLAKPIAPEDAEESRWWENPLEQPEARFVREGALEMASPQRALENPRAGRVPLLEIVVPLQPAVGSGAALGVARYWIDGAPVAAEFARMDRTLALQALAIAVAAFLLAWAFWRLALANRRLEEQRADLARANEELDFAAKTGALGAISAHLIHGLKNPLAGIEGFVAETATASGAPTSGEACRTAMETTRRLRALINEVTTVLRDESAGAADHLVPAAEVVEAARIRAAPAAEQAGVELSVTSEDAISVTARVANLTGLVLANLLNNAIEASAHGGRIALEALRRNGSVIILVSDTGTGLPADVRDALFRPVRSGKRGGGGVGLAISHRLARHAGGELELVRSDRSGTVFRLRVPAA